MTLNGEEVYVIVLSIVEFCKILYIMYFRITSLFWNIKYVRQSLREIHLPKIIKAEAAGNLK